MMNEERQWLYYERSVDEKLTLFNRECYYKGEGNANVVLAFPDDRTIVRVMKCENVEDDNSDKFFRLDAQLDFSQTVRTFFDDYMDMVEVTTASIDELRELNYRIKHLRPRCRINKCLWWTGGWITVSPDYTMLPNSVVNVGPIYCIEIKPKQGWMHSGDRAASTSFGLGTKCTFCAHQFLKAKRTREFSHYCPMNMFSGYLPRVELAIKQLLKTPQNNLTIFENGHMVTWADCTALFNHRKDWLARFVGAALLGNFDIATGLKELPVPSAGSDIRESQVNVKGRACNFETEPLPENCVLGRILKMQKSQTLSFKEVCDAYRNFTCPMNEDQFGHVRRLPDGVNDERTKIVDSYLVAATAQDCSVFVTFCQTTEDNNCPVSTVQYGGCRYAVRIKVADLDPKPLATITKHRQRNIEILQACHMYFTRPPIKCRKCKKAILDCGCDNMYSPVNVIFPK